MVKLLVAEDDPVLRRVICAALEKHGHIAVPASDGEDALRLLEKEHIDLVISDVMMPELDGYGLVDALRGSGCTVPILLVTVLERIEDKRRGFLSGADDYMVKPIDLNELLLRVDALLRRAKIATEHRIVCGASVLDHDSFTVTANGEVVQLPQKEFLLLFKLLSYPGKIFTRSQLMDEIWGVDSETDARTVDVHINRLRDRFRNCEDFSVVTVRGLGYKAVRNDA